MLLVPLANARVKDAALGGGVGAIADGDREVPRAGGGDSGVACRWEVAPGVAASAAVTNLTVAPTARSPHPATP